MKATLWIMILLLLFGKNHAQERMGVVQLTTQAAERRLALVIGMRDYLHVKPLKNTLNDANDMAVALGLLGFKVTPVTEKDRGQTQAEINKFIANLRPTDVVLVYFSGHGIGYLGNNYLLPLDARVECLEQIDAYGISLNQLIADLSTKKVRNSFLILDACRSLGNLFTCRDDQRDPFNQSGLTYPANNPTGNVIVYATQAGRTADDNQTGRNGLFTQELLKYLTIPDLTLSDILDRTADNVLKLSQKMGKTQEPTVYGLRGLKFMFLKTNHPDPMEEYRRRQTELEAENERLKADALKNTRVTPPTRKNDLPPFMRMVPVQGGTFKREDHDVIVSAFSMGKYEVTVGQYLQFCKETNSHWPAWKEKGSDYNIETGKDDHYKKMGKALTNPKYPIVGVSWHNAVAFCDWLSKKEGKVYRLPTEAEWEYAAGGGSTGRTLWAGTNNAKAISMYGNVSVKADGYEYTSPVGVFKANCLGLHDLTGNVWEWCSDWYGDYPKQTGTNPKGPPTGTLRVLRGGSWDNWLISAFVTNHIHTLITSIPLCNSTGFRVVSPSQ